MVSNNGRRSTSKNNYLIGYVLFLLVAVFVSAGMISLQAKGQPDLYRTATLKPAYDEFFTNDIQHT